MADPKLPSDLHAAIFEVKPTGEELAACGPVHLLSRGKKNLDAKDFYGQMSGVSNGRDPLCAQGTPDTYSSSTAPKNPLLNTVSPQGASDGGPIRAVITGPKWMGP